jgi:hypothetical protein
MMTPTLRDRCLRHGPALVHDHVPVDACATETATTRRLATACVEPLTDPDGFPQLRWCSPSETIRDTTDKARKRRIRETQVFSEW